MNSILKFRKQLTILGILLVGFVLFYFFTDYIDESRLRTISLSIITKLEAQEHFYEHNHGKKPSSLNDLHLENSIFSPNFQISRPFVSPDIIVFTYKGQNCFCLYKYIPTQKKPFDGICYLDGKEVSHIDFQ